MKDRDVKTEKCLQDLEALLEGACRLFEGQEQELALNLVYQGLDRIRSL